jgi:5S rRNA maturation endonuclease (ribonuclease M5)
LLRRLKEKEEKIQQVLDELRDQSALGTPILVEGKNDAEALRLLGVQGPLVCVKTGGRSFLDVVSELEKSKATEVVLMLDFDRRGKQGTSRLKQSFEPLGIKVDIELWRRLMGQVHKDVQCIEGLGAYLESLQTKTGISH